MTHRHWTGEELLESFYGIRLADTHLNTCAECRRRWLRIEMRRREVLSGTYEPEISESVLTRQRSKIQRQVQQPSAAHGFFLRPALAAALLVVLALFLSGRARRPEPSVALGGGDGQLYMEIYGLVSSDEPRAVAPIHALFEE